MRFWGRAKARRRLDKRFSQLPGADAFVRPPRGWIKAIREALGMTTKQLAVGALRAADAHEHGPLLAFVRS